MRICFFFHFSFYFIIIIIFDILPLMSTLIMSVMTVRLGVVLTRVGASWPSALTRSSKLDPWITTATGCPLLEALLRTSVVRLSWTWPPPGRVKFTLASFVGGTSVAPINYIPGKGLHC